MTFVREFVSNLNFDLLILTEYFDEGLVVLRRMMCLNMKDILYMKQRDRPGSRAPFDTALEQEMKEVHQEWSKAEYMLYNEANRTFWEQFSQYKGIERELEVFQRLEEEVADFCSTFRMKQNEKQKNYAGQRLHVDASEWNEAFDVDFVFCMLLYMDDNLWRNSMKQVFLTCSSTGREEDCRRIQHFVQRISKLKAPNQRPGIHDW